MIANKSTTDLLIMLVTDAFNNALLKLFLNVLFSWNFVFF